jgi:hypothetical protein
LVSVSFSRLGRRKDSQDLLRAIDRSISRSIEINQLIIATAKILKERTGEEAGSDLMAVVEMYLNAVIWNGEEQADILYQIERTIEEEEQEGGKEPLLEDPKRHLLKRYGSWLKEMILHHFYKSNKLVRNLLAKNRSCREKIHMPVCPKC